MRKNGLWRTVAGFLVLCWGGFSSAQGTPRTGEAIIVSHVGKVEARVFDGAVHDGRTSVVELSDGSSLGEGSRLMTGKESWVCVLLSPGPVLCVAPQTELTFQQLRHTAVGLPNTEDDLIRRVHLVLHQGRVLVHASAPNPSLDLVVRIEAGEVRSTGGSFVVAQLDKDVWAVVSEEHEQQVVPAKGVAVAVQAGEALRLKRKADGTVEAQKDSELLPSPVRLFEVCHGYFEDLEGFVQDPVRFDRAGLGRYLSTPEGIISVVSADHVLDVSPSAPLTARFTRPAATASPAAVGEGRRWDLRRIWNWYDAVGVVKGVNYVPRNAVNSTAMWQQETFDKDLIDEELGWAKQAGYTALRVQLQFVVWKNDRDGFIDRMKTFLGLAAKHDLRVVPVLFDDMNLAKSDPVTGPQPEPVAGEHNARWTPSPGAAAVKDRSVWPELEKYTRDILGEFKRDGRIVFWDLYNRVGDGGLGEASLPVVDQVFNWARDVDPSQPLAVSAWDRFGSAMSSRLLERSDLITFQSFESQEQVQALLLLLKRHERPVLCSDWLMRQQGSTFEAILPLFSLHRVGWFNRGLVQGQTQQWIQRADRRSKEDDKVWQHDVLKGNGEAYEPKELQLIQEFRFQERS